MARALRSAVGVQGATTTHLRLSEVLGALSRALDLADGQSLGHARRTCWIAMRIADELELDEEQRFALFYAVLLKDAGCSANASDVASLYRTDEHAAKRNVRLVDHTRPARAVGYIWRNVGSGWPGGRLFNATRASILAPRFAREMTEIRCERGADIAAMLGLPDVTQQSIRSLNEHWDGHGQPRRLAGQEIPLGSRIALLAETVEIFHRERGLPEAMAVARERSSRWFDPELVHAVESAARDHRFWDRLADEGAVRDLTGIAPRDRLMTLDEQALDGVARAFALVVDGKSPFTFRHSVRVSEIAGAVSKRMGLAPGSTQLLVRAGLLHDLGKLGVSSRVLDKPGALTDRERREIERHPELTGHILSEVPSFADLSAIAVAHHERLDGSGYHRGLTADALSVEARILCVADVFEALTADRPYRDPLEPDAALAELRHEAGARLDADVVEVLAALS